MAAPRLYSDSSLFLCAASTKIVKPIHPQRASFLWLKSVFPQAPTHWVPSDPRLESNPTAPRSESTPQPRKYNGECLHPPLPLPAQIEILSSARTRRDSPSSEGTVLFCRVPSMSFYQRHSIQCWPTSVGFRYGPLPITKAKRDLIFSYPPLSIRDFWVTSIDLWQYSRQHCYCSRCQPHIAIMRASDFWRSLCTESVAHVATATDHTILRLCVCNEFAKMLRRRTYFPSARIFILIFYFRFRLLCSQFTLTSKTVGYDDNDFDHCYALLVSALAELFSREGTLTISTL